MDDKNVSAWKIENWKAYQRNTLQGFFDLSIPPGFTIKGCGYHVKNGKPWVSFPSTVKLDAEGRGVRDNEGKLHYYNCVFIPNRQLLDRFQAWACAELRRIVEVQR